MEEAQQNSASPHEAPAFCQTLLLSTRSPLPYYTGLKTSSYSVIHVFNKHSMTGAHSTLGPVLDTSAEPVWVVAGLSWYSACLESQIPPLVCEDHLC